MDADESGLEHYLGNMRGAFEVAQYVFGDLAFDFGFTYGSGMREEDSIALARAKDAPPGFFEYVFLQALLIARDAEGAQTVKERAGELAKLAWSIESRRTDGQEELANQLMLVLAAEAPRNLTMGQFLVGFAGAMTHISHIGVEIGRRSAELELTRRPDATGWISAFESSRVQLSAGARVGNDEKLNVPGEVFGRAYSTAVHALVPYVSDNVLETLRGRSFVETFVDTGLVDASKDTYEALRPYAENFVRDMVKVARMGSAGSSDRARGAGCGANLIAFLVGSIIFGIWALAVAA